MPMKLADMISLYQSEPGGKRKVSAELWPLIPPEQRHLYEKLPHRPYKVPPKEKRKRIIGPVESVPLQIVELPEPKKKRTLVLQEETVVLLQMTCAALYRHGGGAEYAKRDHTIQAALKALRKSLLDPKHDWE